MFKALLSAAVLLSAYGIAQAGCVGAVVNGQCYGTQVQSYGSSNDQPRYQSNSGAEYQYDRSNPIQNDQYLLDLDAQRRDQMNANPRTQTDHSSGQYGGGIYGGYGSNDSQ